MDGWKTTVVSFWGVKRPIFRGFHSLFVSGVKVPTWALWDPRVPRTHPADPEVLIGSEKLALHSLNIRWWRKQMPGVG